MNYSIKPDVQEIKDNSGNIVTFSMMLANTKCMVCRLPVTPQDGICYALAQPYHGVLHNACFPNFSFNGRWPHEYPWVCYMGGAGGGGGATTGTSVRK